MATNRLLGEPGLFFRTALALLLAAVAAGVGLVLLTEPSATGLAGAVEQELARSGAENPVTAVLLNFRGYDTLLEIAVLTAALVSVWALGPAPRIKETTPSPVLLGMNSVLIPLAPWFLDGNPHAQRRAQAEQLYGGLDNATLSRLFALGVDAVTLLPWLDVLRSDPALHLPGLTGRLSIDPHGLVERDLPIVRLVGGRPVPE